MCLIGYGERGCGKSTALFGDVNDIGGYSPSTSNTGISYEILSQIYHLATLQPGVTTIAVSAWTIKGSQIIE